MKNTNNVKIPAFVRVGHVTRPPQAQSACCVLTRFFFFY